MYSIVVLGARCTGKTTLAAHCLGTHYRSVSGAPQASPYHFLPRIPVAFDEMYFDSVHNAVVLDPKPNAAHDSLARDLARRTVRACLVAFPRDTSASFTQHAAQCAVQWVQFAREHCPSARVALVATKNDMAGAQDSSLSSRDFDALTLDVMQRGAFDRMFFTEATTPEGLKSWLLDVLTHASARNRSSINLEQFGAMSSRRKDTKYRASKKRDGCGNDQRSCDSCAVS